MGDGDFFMQLTLMRMLDLPKKGLLSTSSWIKAAGDLFFLAWQFVDVYNKICNLGFERVFYFNIFDQL
jgi:hypothetical protein